MQKEHRRMEIKYFVYFLLLINLLLLIFNGFFWMIGYLHKAKEHNDLILIIFSILELIVVGSIIWLIILFNLHKKKIYSKTSIVILGIFAFVGIPIIQLILWFVHYTNWKITKNNINFHIQKVEEEK